MEGNEKVKYVAPEALSESFELSQHIAAGCENTSGAAFGDPASCAFFTGTAVIFTGGVGDCATKTGANRYDIYCYNNPNDTFSIFQS